MSKSGNPEPRSSCSELRIEFDDDSSADKIEIHFLKMDGTEDSSVTRNTKTLRFKLKGKKLTPSLELIPDGIIVRLTPK